MTVPLLVATDLDGTLLRTDGTLSERTRAVLRSLDERGVPVVVVSARPIRWMDHLLDTLGRHGLASLGNGAVLIDLRSGEPLEVNAIEHDVARDLVADLRAAAPGVAFGVECLSGMLREEAFPAHPGDVCVVGLEGWHEPVLKLLVGHPDLRPADALRELVTEVVGERGTPTWSVDWLVEIGPPGVTKATSLARLAERFGVPREAVAAFGDMPNDVPMLRWAGTSYAVANAHADVRAVADRMVPGNDDDGVAVTLAALFDL